MPKTNIHFVGGDRGRVGKSTWCCLLANYLQANEQPFTIVDTDTSNPNVAKAYGGVTDIQFQEVSEDAALFDFESLDGPVKIFDMASEKDLIVNLGAATQNSFLSWIEHYGVNTSTFGDSTIYKWFVSNGDEASLRSLATLRSKCNYETIVVCNKGVRPTFWSESAIEQLEQQGVLCVELAAVSGRIFSASLDQGKPLAEYYQSLNNAVFKAQYIQTIKKINESFLEILG